MRRLVLLILLIAPFAAAAQDKIYRIAVIEAEVATRNTANFAAFRQGLRELGYVEGRNLAIGYRSTEGDDARYPALCREAVERKADLILAHGAAAAAACQKTTRSLPILFAGVADPVADGLVTDIGHPGGNLTGAMVASGPLVTAMRLDLLREIFPRIALVGAMANFGSPEIARQRQQAETAARELGVGVRLFDVRSVADLRTAFAIAANDRLGAIYVASDTFTETNRQLVGSLGLKHRLPIVAGEASFVEAGSLLSYGADESVQYKRLAGIADRILRGAKPADIPVERPTTFNLAVNLKTARALGVRIPRQVLSRADRVIQ